MDAPAEAAPDAETRDTRAVWEAEPTTGDAETERPGMQAPAALQVPPFLQCAPAGFWVEALQTIPVDDEPDWHFLFLKHTLSFFPHTWPIANSWH